MVSRASSIDTEYTSDLTLWIVLACSALALVVFFGWFSISESALSLHQGKSLRVQPLSETLTASDNSNKAVSAIELAESETSSLVLPSSESSVNGDEGYSGQQYSSAPELMTASAGLAAPTTIVATRDAIVEEVSDAMALPMKASPALPDGGVGAASSTVQRNTVEQGTENPGNSALDHPRQESADLSALRQLLAEASVITADEDEQVRAKRERHEILQSLDKLSAALRFAPGSKVVNEVMMPVLGQINRILADYPETRINVIVATHEKAGDKQDILLSQERGRALIARLVNEGLAFSRFSLEAISDRQLPENSHRVVIQAHSES